MSGIVASSGHQSGVSCAHACQVTPIFCTLLPGVLGNLVLSSSSELPASSWRKWSISGPNSSGGSRSKSRRGSLAPPSSPDSGPHWGDYTQRRGQALLLPNPGASPASSPGSSPLAVTAPRVGMGVQPALSDGPAQPLSYPLRWPWLLGLSGGLPLPQQGLTQQGCPFSPSWGFCTWEAGHLPDQAPPNLGVVCPVSASGNLSGRTLPQQSIPPSAPAHRVGILVTF